MKELRYAIGQLVEIRPDSEFAQVFKVPKGNKAEIVGFDEEDDYDYSVDLHDGGCNLLINDDELF